MKTKGLDYLEAVKALKDKVCKEIESEITGARHYIDYRNCLSYTLPLAAGISTSPKSFSASGILSELSHEQRKEQPMFGWLCIVAGIILHMI